MIRQRKEELLASVGLVVLFVLGLIGFWFFMQTTIDNQCKQFGEGWTGKVDTYGPDFCVNDKGEAKYPK